MNFDGFVAGFDVRLMNVDDCCLLDQRPVTEFGRHGMDGGPAMLAVVLEVVDVATVHVPGSTLLLLPAGTPGSAYHLLMYQE